jgi:hypothetical protein
MPVPQNPTIVIYFTGLLAFCLDKQRGCFQIGVLSKDDHELRLRCVKKVRGLEQESEQILTISHSLIRQTSDLWLDVEGQYSTGQSTAEPFIAGGPSESPTDPQDFRRVLDLEGEHFYNRPLKVRRDVLRPILFVAKGLFYTATLTSDVYQTLPVAADGKTRTPAAGRSLGQIAEHVGANFYLTRPNQALVLRAGQNGAELLRLEREEGMTYEITIDNGDTPLAPAGSDIHYYYDAVKMNPGEPKILVEPCGFTLLRGREAP